VIQIYLLSVILNAFVGCYFAFELKTNQDINYVNPLTFLSNKNFKLAIGILTTLVGILKLLSSMDVVFVGDLLPAVAGICGGSLVLYEYYIAESKEESHKIEIFEKFETSGKKYLGYFCLIVAIVHFIAPKVLFL
jgi:hypothetical protein